MGRRRVGELVLDGSRAVSKVWAIKWWCLAYYIQLTIKPKKLNTDFIPSITNPIIIKIVSKNVNYFTLIYFSLILMLDTSKLIYYIYYNIT